MRPLRCLVLTDHSGHSDQNSLYSLVAELSTRPGISEVCVASRAHPGNRGFFSDPFGAGSQGQGIYGTTAGADFNFLTAAGPLTHSNVVSQVTDFDWVWLRLPPPLSPTFLGQLRAALPAALLINDPAGIIECGSKAFLLNFPEWTARTNLVKTARDLEDRVSDGPLVLKPLRDYGGKGLFRIDGAKVWAGSQPSDYATVVARLAASEEGMLAVDFLPGIGEGDKRIVVVNGRIIGASLRRPAAGAWLCNVAAGGTSSRAGVDDHERAMISAIGPQLTARGIVMYGVDTLVGKRGHRILSEVNATSIGGIPQMGPAAVAATIDGVLSYVQNKLK